jgi:hypothetical protein
VDIEHPNNNVVIMYPATKNAARTKNGKSGFPFGDITFES